LDTLNKRGLRIVGNALIHDDLLKTADGKTDPENKPDYLAFRGKVFLQPYPEHEHPYGKEA